MAAAPQMASLQQALQTALQAGLQAPTSLGQPNPAAPAQASATQASGDAPPDKSFCLPASKLCVEQGGLESCQRMPKFVDVLRKTSQGQRYLGHGTSTLQGVCMRSGISGVSLCRQFC